MSYIHTSTYTYTYSSWTHRHSISKIRHTQDTKRLEQHHIYILSLHTVIHTTTWRTHISILSHTPSYIPHAHAHTSPISTPRHTYTTRTPYTHTTHTSTDLHHIHINIPSLHNFIHTTSTSTHLHVSAQNTHTSAHQTQRAYVPTYSYMYVWMQAWRMWINVCESSKIKFSWYHFFPCYDRCVCVCVCQRVTVVALHVCMHAFIYACMYVHPFMHVCMCMHLCMYACACMHAYIHLCMHACTCLHAYVHMCMHTYMLRNAVTPNTWQLLQHKKNVYRGATTVT